MTAQIGFLIGFKEHEIWLFPEDISSMDLSEGTMTYTMTNGSSALKLGDGDSVGEFVDAILNSVANDAQQATGQVAGELTALLSGLPEPFASVSAALTNLDYYLESLRLSLSWTTSGDQRQYSTGYEIGVSVRKTLTAPAPLDAFALKGIYLKLAG